MTTVIDREQIERALPGIDVTGAIEAGFVAYSRGEVVVPPVGELLFEQPRGEAHIKYGYIKGDDWFVIKVASGFYDNFKLGLPTNSGLMLLFSQKTGVLEAVLLDEGILTAERTAAAGAVAARHLAPRQVRRIGIVGSGDQARRQLRYLLPIVDCRDVLVWGRDAGRLADCRRDMEALGFSAGTTEDTAEVAGACDLIVTVTPATEPLLRAADIRSGTHITAVGSDTADKQELDAAILARADIVVADSLEQCRSRGEIYRAVAARVLHPDKAVELGSVIADATLRRSSDGQITVADLTGVAVQDIQISKAVYAALS
jgi:ornithine cyclodeaminase